MTTQVPGSIGPYTIQRELGRGGMGVVYLATDTRLDRSVAIKALPEHLALDPDRLTRFQREARVLASLNHPNLAGIYGVEEQGGAKYLVLEFVDGETLEERLDRGPLPFDEAVELAVQIAAGIEAAHEAGVIHRDLKPANIKITPDGVAKVLDFGLARADGGESSSTRPDAETVTTPPPRRPTMEGAILGTAAYMSPEQARGRRVDKRSDIWSFGVVLYEMLAGSSPFRGETAGDSIGAVLHKQFDFDELPPATPRGIRRVLARCLQRDRNLRFRDIGDVRIELMAMGEDPTDHAAGVEKSRRRTLLVLVLLFLAVLAPLGFVAVRGSSAPAAGPVIADVHLDLPEEHTLASWPFPRVSRDGTRVVLVAQRGGQRYLIVRDLRDRSCRELPNSQGAFEPGISPDGQWISFQQDGLLKRVAVEGGPSITICDPGMVRGTLWIDQNRLVIGQSQGPLQITAIDSGSLAPLYSVPSDQAISDRHPALLPDASGVVFTRVPGDGGSLSESEVWLYQFAREAPVLLVRGAAHPFVIPSGHLLFMRDGTLMAASFDAKSQRITSAETPLVGNVLDSGPAGPRLYDISRSGSFVYFDSTQSANIRSDRAIQRLTADGAIEDLFEARGAYGWVSLSTDGSMVAFTEEDSEAGGDQLRVLDLNKGVVRTISSDVNGNLSRPVWHPSGDYLYFSVRSGEDAGFYRARVEGFQTPERLTSSDGLISDQFPWHVRPDGSRMLVSALNKWEGIYEYELDSNGRIVGDRIPLIETEARCIFPKYSPDGKWLAFIIDRPKTGFELFVTSLEDPSGTGVQVSTGEAADVEWVQGRQALVYANLLNGVDRAYRVEFTVDESGVFRPGLPEPTFDLRGIRFGGSAVEPSGESVIAVRRPGADDSTGMIPRVGIGWTDFIARKLPRPSP